LTTSRDPLHGEGEVLLGMQVGKVARLAGM